MPKSLDEIIQDPRFNKMSTKDQQNFVMEYIQKYPPGGPKGPDATEVMNPVTPDSVRESREDSTYGQPLIGDTTVGHVVGGLGLGALTGGSAPTGQLISMALNGLMPPKTPGQMAAVGLAGPMSKLTGPIASAPKSGALKAGGAGIAGLLNLLGLNTATGAIDKGTDISKDDIIPSLPQMALGVGGPMATQILGSNLVKKSPLSVNAAAVNDLTQGKTKPINTAQLGSFFMGDQNASPELQAIQQAGGRPAQTEAQNLAAQAKAKASLDNIALEKKKLSEAALDIGTDKTQAKVDFLRQKMEAETYGGPDVPGKPVAPSSTELALKTTQKDLEKQAGDWRTRQLATREETLKQGLTKLQDEASNRNNALPPDVVKLANAKSPREMMQNIGTTSPEGVAAFKDHIERQIGKKGVTDLQDAFVEQFFKEAYNGDTKLMSNAQGLFYGSGQPGDVARFSPDKIRAVFGQDAKVEQFKKAVDMINDVDPTNKMNEPGFFGKFQKSASSHLGWVLPNMLVFHPETAVQSGGMLAGTAATSYMAVQYPKFLRMVMENPKTADSFNNWIHAGATQAALKNFPRAAAWLKSNSDEVSQGDLQ